MENLRSYKLFLNVIGKSFHHEKLRLCEKMSWK